MKKSILKVLALTLTLALLFGCLGILTVFADSEESVGSEQVRIVAQNLVYAEKIQIAYAVDYDTETANDNVKLAYTVEGSEAKLATYWGVEEVNGTNYPVFVTEGFHANEFTKSVSAVAYTGDAAPEGASTKTYSVGQYFYTMLYYHNYVNASNADDVARKDLYESAIAFGTNAQRVIDKASGDELLNQYCFIWSAEEGVTVNGASTAFVKAGTEIELAGASAYTVGVESNITEYTAVAGAILPVVAYVEDTYSVADYEGGYPYGNYVKTYGSDGVLVENTSWATGGNTSTAGLDVDPKNAANHVLHVRTGANATNNFTTKVSPSNTIQTGSCYTFQTRAYAVGFGGDNYIFANLKFVNANGTSALDLNLKSINNSASKPSVAITTNGTSSNLAENTTLFDYNEKSIQASVWFTVRVELYYAGGDNVSGDEAIEAARANTYLKVYVDDVLAYDGNAHWVVTSDIDHVELVHTVAGKAQNMEYDDIFFTRTNKQYVAGNEYAE